MSSDLIRLIRKGWKITSVTPSPLTFTNVDEASELSFALVPSPLCDSTPITSTSNFRSPGYNGLPDLTSVSPTSWLATNETLTFGLFSWKKWKNFYKLLLLKWQKRYFGFFYCRKFVLTTPEVTKKLSYFVLKVSNSILLLMQPWCVLPCAHMYVHVCAFPL